MFKIKNSIILILILLVCLSFSFCTNKAPQELIAVSVGYLPSLAASPLYSAIVKGYFKEEGLNVRIQEIYSGPELVNALQGKAIDIAFGIVGAFPKSGSCYNNGFGGNCHLFQQVPASCFVIRSQ